MQGYDDGPTVAGCPVPRKDPPCGSLPKSSRAASVSRSISSNRQASRPTSRASKNAASSAAAGAATFCGPLFPAYLFVVVELQWHAAHHCPGVVRLVMDGSQPARVPEAVINAIKERELNGVVRLPPPPALRQGPGARRPWPV